jgi:hypothetical protein
MGQLNFFGDPGVFMYWQDNFPLQKDKTSPQSILALSEPRRYHLPSYLMQIPTNQFLRPCDFVWFDFTVLVTVPGSRVPIGAEFAEFDYDKLVGRTYTSA